MFKFAEDPPHASDDTELFVYVLSAPDKMEFNNSLDLPEYIPEEELRQALKIYNRQFTQYTKLKVALTNNLIALSDQTFPGIDGLFGKTPRKDGHQKWIDFIKDYWHKDCITTKTIKSLERSYQK